MKRFTRAKKRVMAEKQRASWAKERAAGSMKQCRRGHEACFLGKNTVLSDRGTLLFPHENDAPGPYRRLSSAPGAWSLLPRCPSPCVPTLYDLLPRAGDVPTNDFLLGRFLEYVEAAKLELYPAQEAAVLELFEERNVILNTPTGSGKSLVAMALQFKALAQGKRSVYTCPIKALVNEKWLALCREFGADNVGLSTGDGTVNHDAPILCCTAEILANMALSEGSRANVQDVIMDEFHYYSDRERGGAWQVPLLALPQARFLLMSPRWGTRSFRGGTDRAEREADGHGALDAAARAAGFPVQRNAAGADRGGAGHRREGAGVRGAFHAGGGGGKRAGFHQPGRLQQGGEGGDCPAVGGLPVRESVRRRRSSAGCGTASGCTTRGCCRSTGCWSSSWRSAGCSR